MLPRMGAGSLTRIALLLVFVSLCLSKDLSKEQIDYFKKTVKSWGAPAVAKVIGGSSEKNEKGTQVLILNYTSDTGKRCTAELETYKDGKQGHGFTCVHTGKAEGKKGEKKGGGQKGEVGKMVRVTGKTDWEIETEEPEYGEGMMVQTGTVPTATEEDFDRR